MEEAKFGIFSVTPQTRKEEDVRSDDQILATSSNCNGFFPVDDYPVQSASHIPGGGADDALPAAVGGGGPVSPIASCASAVLQLNSGERPVPCGFEGRAPVVCCPPPADDNGKAGDLQALQVSAPAVDFECGDSTPVEVPLVFGLSRVSRSNLQKDSLAAVGIAPPDIVPPVVGGFPARRVLAKYTIATAGRKRCGDTVVQSRNGAVGITSRTLKGPGEETLSRMRRSKGAELVLDQEMGSASRNDDVMNP
ncbi:hypothetical protein C7M84_021405 [Penaeus vannamei]|uniref:Uncharacterized protein n=1 Tax=Penaeus vannamei TaxID=6689 RepID=A0A423U8N2_PENVA|nr:hypothetical protein C7M84_021405 [Penaeus vannamei]